MDDRIDWEGLRLQLKLASASDTTARDRLMPRDAAGNAARPSVPPPGAVPRLGAVLLLLYPIAGELHVPLTVRTGSLRHHSGEVSLPGGSFDAADGTLDRTALREAWEELGITAESVEIVTDLTPVWISVSNFLITPYVGFIAEQPVLKPAPPEVAEVIEVPISLLVKPEIVHSEIRNLRGDSLRIPYFAIGSYKVWGATGLILAELAGRLQSR